MKQCETCFWREHKNELFCCAVSHVREAFREFLRGVPFFRARLQEYECQAYEPDPGLFINKTLHLPDEKEDVEE